MTLTAVYRDGEVIKFPIKGTVVNGSYRNSEGKRPVSFIAPEGLGVRAMEYLKGYVYPNYDEKVKTVEYYNTHSNHKILMEEGR